MKRFLTVLSIAIGISFLASHADAGQVPFHEAGKARLKHAAKAAGNAVCTDVAHCGKRHGRGHYRQPYRGGYGYPQYRGYRGGHVRIGAPAYYGGYGGYGYGGGYPRSCGYGGGYGGYGYGQGGGFGLSIGW